MNICLDTVYGHKGVILEKNKMNKSKKCELLFGMII